MKKSAALINISRGSIIKEEDLYIALKKNIIREAFIDVWYNYPKNSVTKKSVQPKDPPG